MTLDELNAYPYVLRAVERYEIKLAELYDDSVGSMSPDMSGMPHGRGGMHSKVVAGYERNETMITQISERLNDYLKQLRRYEEFFKSIDDVQTFQIFELRFKELLSWEQVAARVGGNNTKDSVKQICYRYLKKSV